MDENRVIRRRRDPAANLILGGFFLLVGALLLARNLGLEIPIGIWRLWPFLLILLGVTRLLVPGSSEKRSSGFWLVVAGLYGWIGTQHLFGLSWTSAWPIFIIGVGVQLLIQATLGAGRGGVEHERT